MTKDILRVLKAISGKQDQKLHQSLEQFKDKFKDFLTEEELSCISYYINAYGTAQKFPSVDDFLFSNPIYADSEEFVADVSIQTMDVESKLAEIGNILSNRNASIRTTRLSSSVTRELSEGIFDIKKIKEIAGITEEMLKRSSSSSIDMFKMTPESIIGSTVNELAKEDGLITGFSKIDEKIGTIRPGNVFIIGGYAGDGKTTMALNIFHKNVYELGFNCIYFSLEMSIVEIVKNIVTLHSNYLFEHGVKGLKSTCLGYDVEADPIPITRRLQRENPKEYIEQYSIAYTDFFSKSKGRFYIFEEEGFESNDFELFRDAINKIDDEWMKNDPSAEGKKHAGVDAVFWDHANLFKFNNTRFGGSKGTSVGESINAFLSNIRNLGHNFRKDNEGRQRYLTNFVLMQLNREARKKAQSDNCGYTLEALAEANEGERCAAYVLTIYSDKNTKQEKQAMIQLLKHRFGEVVIEPEHITADLEHYTLKDLTTVSEAISNSMDVSGSECKSMVEGYGSPYDDNDGFSYSGSFGDGEQVEVPF